MLCLQIVAGAMDEEYIHLWPAAMLTSALMLAFKCLNGDQARSSIDWEVYICIAFAFAVSTAMEKTKVALAIAQLFVRISKYLFISMRYSYCISPQVVKLCTLCAI